MSTRSISSISPRRCSLWLRKLPGRLCLKRFVMQPHNALACSVRRLYRSNNLSTGYIPSYLICWSTSHVFSRWLPPVTDSSKASTHSTWSHLTPKLNSDASADSRTAFPQSYKVLTVLSGVIAVRFSWWVPESTHSKERSLMAVWSVGQSFFKRRSVLRGNSSFTLSSLEVCFTPVEQCGHDVELLNGKIGKDDINKND